MSYVVLLSIIYKPKFLSFNKFSFNKLSAFDRQSTLNLNDDNFTRPFFNAFYYLQKDANLDRFCKENGIDDKEEFHDLIIIKFNMSFNNLINKYRVQYFLDLVKSNKYSNYSIDALAQESGFNSRHHLYKPFKKFHGGTPSDFIYYASN
jgi:AraC-like DNA-binding protein